VLTEDPRIDRVALICHLDEEYGFAATEIDFLPVGGDGHNNGYGGPWFVSVKRGNSDPRRTARWAVDFDASHRAVRRLVDEGGLQFLSAALPSKDGRGRVTGSFADALWWYSRGSKVRPALIRRGLGRSCTPAFGVSMRLPTDSGT
jgi:hypothetical protein